MTSKKNLSRRDFVKLCGVAGLAFAAPVGLTPLAEAFGGPNHYTRTRLKMGTIVTITIVSDSENQAQEGFAAAFEEMDRLIEVFDRHRPGTVISTLNEQGRLSDPGPEFLEVLEQAKDVHLLSGKAFDPTVLPLLSVIEKDFVTLNRAPKAEELSEVMELVDFGAVSFGTTGVSFGKSGQKISLDGVAKGYIVDRAGARLRAVGIRNALINAGGDILALGTRKNGQPWRIGIQDPENPKNYLRVIGLSQGAVTTSGSYEIFFDSEKHYHHLINPFQGTSATAMVSATVISETVARADALSTAAFIKPELITREGKAEGMVVSSHGRQQLTPGFKNLLA